MSQPTWVNRVHGNVSHCAHGISYREICGFCWQPQKTKDSSKLQPCPHAEPRIFCNGRCAECMEDEIERLTELLRAYETICERYQAVFAVKYRPADETIADRVYAMSPHTGDDCKVCHGPDDEVK